jgi:gamma-glutamyltranspeptidase/glutathione hydrolase
MAMLERLPVAAAALVLALAALAGGCATLAPTEIHRIETAPAANAAATAHPLATRAALDVLARGGAPIDAAIAAQMVLGLVEPQSSGMGGGTLIMLWDAGTRQLVGFDGLAAAPAAATAGLRVDADGMTLPLAPLRHSGRAVGVPGTLAVLEQAHRRYGKLPWPELFAAAIAHAEHGFPMPPYMHRLLSGPHAARDHAQLLALYFGADGRVLPLGTIIRNPAYAQTLRRVAEHGAAGLYRDGGGMRFVAAARAGYRPTLITAADLADYRPRERVPLCAPFLVYTVCTMAPPSFGGIVVLQMLQMVEARAEGRYDFDDPAFVHLYAEAGRLAQADRRRYVGDPDFVRVPAQALIARAYLRQRALEIDPQRSVPRPSPGRPEQGSALPDGASDSTQQHPATSQIAIADRFGNAVSITTTINLNFGARLMVDGYVLNDAMINFSQPPAAGRPIANQMAPGKRPVSAMAPTIVFDARGEPVLVGGSAGGGYIVDYIAGSLIDMLANGLTPAQALAQGHVSSADPGKLRLERGTSRAALAAALRARGHVVEVRTMPSGLGFIKRGEDGWLGAADPRRDGIAAGF